MVIESCHKWSNPIITAEPHLAAFVSGCFGSVVSLSVKLGPRDSPMKTVYCISQLLFCVGWCQTTFRLFSTGKEIHSVPVVTVCVMTVAWCCCRASVHMEWEVKVGARLDKTSDSDAGGGFIFPLSHWQSVLFFLYHNIVRPQVMWIICVAVVGNNSGRHWQTSCFMMFSLEDFLLFGTYILKDYVKKKLCKIGCAMGPINCKINNGLWL